MSLTHQTTIAAGFTRGIEWRTKYRERSIFLIQLLCTCIVDITRYLLLCHKSQPPSHSSHKYIYIQSWYYSEDYSEDGHAADCNWFPNVINLITVHQYSVEWNDMREMMFKGAETKEGIVFTRLLILGIFSRNIINRIMDYLCIVDCILISKSRLF